MPYNCYLWRNSRFSISGERMGTIVHDALVIVTDAIVGDSAIIVLVEVMLPTCESLT